MPTAPKMSHFHRMQVRELEITAYRDALIEGLEALKAHLSLPKFCGTDEKGVRKDWIATGDVLRMVHDMMHAAQVAADEVATVATREIESRKAA